MNYEIFIDQRAALQMLHGPIAFTRAIFAHIKPDAFATI